MQSLLKPARTAAAVIVLLTLVAAGARGDVPRGGYWCGFRAGASASLPTPAPSPVQFVGNCRAAEHLLTPRLGIDALPSAFILRQQSGHDLLESFRLGFDARTIFEEDAFSEASDGYAVSDNGRTLSGSFSSPTSFAGTYARGRITWRYWAWWVGRRCSRYARVFYFGCSG